MTTENRDSGTARDLPAPEVRPGQGPRPPQVRDAPSGAADEECARCDHQWHGAFRPLVVMLFQWLRKKWAERKA